MAQKRKPRSEAMRKLLAEDERRKAIVNLATIPKADWAHSILTEALEFLENGTPIRQGSLLHLRIRGLMMELEGK